MIPFTVDPSWYQSYWYGRCSTPTARPFRPSLFRAVILVALATKCFGHFLQARLQEL